MDSFIGIRFKKETAKRFQTFSRTYFKSHTEAMSTMLDFFFYNEISPKEKLGPTGRTMEAKLKALQQQGYARIKVNDTVIRIDEAKSFNKKDTVLLVVDRIIIKNEEDFQSGFNSEQFSTTTHQLRIIKKNVLK